MKPSLYHQLLFVAVLSAAMTAQAEPATTSVAAPQKIDELLAAHWQKEKLTANPPAGDDVLVRRLHLDIAGRIPTYRETEEFLADTSKDKRSRLIDTLLTSEGYAQHFFNYWADILRLQGQLQGGLVGGAYFNWIKDSLRENKPYDQLVREMVASKGKVWNSPGVGYYFRDRNMPLDNMAATVRIFLGTRIECAQCHNHPFDKWTQMQFYQLGAHYTGLSAREDDFGKNMIEANRMLKEKTKANLLSNEEVNGFNDAIRHIRVPFILTSVTQDEWALHLPHDYQYDDAKPKTVVAPAVLFGKAAPSGAGVKRMDSYAGWMTSKDNARFTKVIANRLWKKVFGVGLIEPVDEIMDNTVGANPALMTYLKGLMKELNFDMKGYLRVLYNTSAYQRTVSRQEAVPGEPWHFTGPLLRRMTAEQMWDSFVTLINPTPDMPNEPTQDTQAKRLAGVKKLSEALDTLTPDEILEGARVSAKKFAEIAIKMKEVETKIIAARSAGDIASAKELTKAYDILKASQSATRQIVHDLIFTKGIQRLEGQQAGLKKTAAAPAPPAMNAMDMQMATSGYISGKDKHALTDGQQKQLRDEAARFGLTGERLAAFLKSRAAGISRWLRAAEISSPAPRGHYLRDFGQSDRETIENANHDASVPQALTLMNSELLPEILGPFSALNLTLSKMNGADQQMQATYLTLLSRKPTAVEQATWQKARDSGIGQIDDLIFALINTQQFIFIQ
ncbi:MAG: DUF1549 domain-containing protein [Prosthecobacter sp.]|uniref:DUF1549 domain-containing protein n=1 Tax=Prosthecobacter sp. TaxID=1965333 RepID=UPI003902AB61